MKRSAAFMMISAALMPIWVQGAESQAPENGIFLAQAQPPGQPRAPQSGERSYARYLVESMVARHPDIIELDLHALRPGGAQLELVAAKSGGRAGRPSDADDVAVFRNGEPRVEINKRGDQNVEVAVPLYDIYKQAIGAVEFTLRYQGGTDKEALLHQAAQYRDEMSRRILDAASLFDPAQLDESLGARTLAQYLVDDALGRYAGVEVISLHAKTPRTGADYPIVASNIGRIGKPADADDMKVITSGATTASPDARGARFEVKLPLKDASGATIGAAAIVYNYGATSSPDTIRRQAEAIVADWRGRLPNAAALDAPYPSTRPTELVNAIDEYNKQELGNKQNLPMTKEVVSGAALEQSTQEGYSDAIKNVAGVQPTNSSGSPNDAFSIRGIKLNLVSNYRLDGGVPTAGVITSPTENKERVETLKGANALMFGVASPAGIINFVSKRAGPRDVTSVGIAGNSFGQYGGSFDIGRRFGSNSDFGVRINASAAHLENGVRDMDGQGHFASAGVDWRATSKLTFQFDFEEYEKHVPEQAGISLLAAVNNVVPITRVPDPRNLLSGTWNEYSPRTTNYQGRVDYQIADGWKVLAQAGESESHRHRNTVRIGSYNADTGAGGIVTVQPINNDYRNTFARLEVLGSFRTWILTHDLTIGISRTERGSSTYGQNNVTLTQRQNIFDPIVLAPPVFTKADTTLPAQRSKDVGTYAYDTVGVFPSLKLLLGIRETKDTEVVGSTISTSNVTSPAYGVLWDVLPTTTLFASYMEGLEAGGTAPANAANANVILAPAISKQKEIGIRDSFFRGLSISASYFDIERANAITDPVSNIFGYYGELSYKGVEATASYEVTRALTLNGAVLWLKALQQAPVTPLVDGKIPENTPKWNGNVSVQYKLPWVTGLTLRAGVKAIAKRPVNNQDQSNIPGYTLYDIGASYATRLAGKRVSFQLGVDNLANKRYWNSVQTGTYGIGMDRSVKFSAKMDF